MKAENEKSRVYKYKTLEEIAEALQDNCSLEDDIGNGCPSTRYYIHISENVCEDLLEQVNAYIKERELEDD